MDKSYLGKELESYTVDGVTVKPNDRVSVVEKSTGNAYTFGIESIHINDIYGTIAIVKSGGYYAIDVESNKNYYSETSGGVIILNNAKIIVYKGQ